MDSKTLFYFRECWFFGFLRNQVENQPIRTKVHENGQSSAKGSSWKWSFRDDRRDFHSKGRPLLINWIVHYFHETIIHFSGFLVWKMAIHFGSFFLKPRGPFALTHDRLVYTEPTWFLNSFFKGVTFSTVISRDQFKNDRKLRNHYF